MERELIDIFIWYRKYKKIPEISEEITAADPGVCAEA